MNRYKLVCNVRANTWSVTLDGVEVHQTNTVAEAVSWIKERR